jgi:hypothetical protein
LAGCTKVDMVPKLEYAKLKDSIETIHVKIKIIPALRDSIRELNDSITYLNSKPLMTKAQFIELYKFGRLNKYYRICRNNPTQWKYYKGWTVRVFENQ